MQGAVTVWQGDVKLNCSPVENSPPPYHAISSAVATTLFLLVTLFSITSYVFICSVEALCLLPGVYLLSWTLTHTTECHMEISVNLSRTFLGFRSVSFLV